MGKLTLKNETLKGIDLRLNGWSWQILACLALLLSPFQSIISHGTVTSPPSRVWICFQENPESPDSPACEAAIIGYGTQAFYDWSEVARMDAGGDHRRILSDGNLASAGRPDKYGGLDQVRNDWVSTEVSAGPFQVIWTNQAPHRTLYYDVYITKASWTPDQPLTWDNLELLTRTNPRDAAATDIIDVTLPERTGKHVIYSIWQRSLTPEAFYSTSDVDFGNGSGAPTDVRNNTAPVADLITTSSSGRSVSFSAAGSSDADGDGLTYRYDFGDGTQSQDDDATATHLYRTSGTFTATLLVADSRGLTDTSTITVTVTDNGQNQQNNPPSADLAVTPSTTGVAPFAVRFDASGSRDPEGTTLSYSINYGDGNTGNDLSANSAYTYVNAGVYTATLTVRDANDATDTASVTITVNEAGVTPPNSGFVYSENTQDDFSDDANTPSGPFALLSGNNTIEATQSGSPRDIDYFTVTIPAGYELSELNVSEFSDTNNIAFIGITEGNTSAPQTGVGLLGGTTFGQTIGANLLDVPASLNGPGFNGSLSAGNYTVWLNQTAGTTTTKLTFVVTEANVAPSNVDGGVITGGPFTFTVGDGIADNVSGVALSGNVGETSQWVVTDDQRNILGLPGTPEAVDFDGAGVGMCYIYHLSHNGDISGLAPNANLSGLTGDFDLSNRIDVIRNAADSDVDGGQITGGPFTFTVGDGIADNVSGVNLSGNIGATSQWVVTDDQRNILGLPPTPEAVNFDGAGVGTCFIYHLSYNGTITGLAEQANLSGLGGDFDLSNRIEVVRTAASSNVDGGQITGGPFTFTVGDGIADNVSGVNLSGNVGATSQWVVTDDQRNILGLPPTPEAVNFDGAGVGTCFIYHLSYNGAITGLSEQANLSGLAGDFDLSNRIEVVRNAPIPGGGSCSFGAPLSSPLSTITSSYNNAYVIGNGGPDLSIVNNFTVNWDLRNRGLYQFSFNLRRAPWFINFTNATQNFDEPNPRITLSETGIANLDGDYYATTDGENFVLVADGYTIYFSNSTTAPDCVTDQQNIGAKNINELEFATLFPNPAVTSVTIQNETDLNNSSIAISDLSGRVIKSLSVTESTTSVTIDISGVSSGLYLVRISDLSGSTSVLKLIVN